MRKYTIFFGLILVSMICSQVFAGGYEKAASTRVVGTPPEVMARVTNIVRSRGDGKPFYPIVDFLARICNHTIPGNDKKPGPGYGVPEGHVIGNAPAPYIIGKVMDRSRRGKCEPAVDFVERIKRHHAE